MSPLGGTLDPTFRQYQLVGEIEERHQIAGQDGKLKVAKTPNGSNPLATKEGKALLGCDVWEHSYYLDFRNRRPDYLQNWLDKLANYEFAEAQLG